MFLQLIVSTIVYFVATFFIRRKMDEMDFPKGMTRSMVIFVGALTLAYVAAAAVDWVAGHV